MVRKLNRPFDSTCQCLASSIIYTPKNGAVPSGTFAECGSIDDRINQWPLCSLAGPDDDTYLSLDAVRLTVCIGKCRTVVAISPNPARSYGASYSILDYVHCGGRWQHHHPGTLSRHVHVATICIYVVRLHALPSPHCKTLGATLVWLASVWRSFLFILQVSCLARAFTSNVE